ncbi:bacteriohemerythrin [Clostridium rectalis]|uniref:bacteriohemerythrin n=1 Tax=Clostridium rectalis TaxID=2040295 RepID=UPI000F63B831|nr:bacteriohemerythrin [Clostridium rectalis]
MMWKEKYRVGVDLIDLQHKELFKRVSEFINIVQDKNTTKWKDKIQQIKKTMIFMQEYVVSHFDAEEAYQKKINYPDKKNHEKIHSDFKNMVNNYAIRLEKENYPEELVKELAGKLMTWLIMHVTQTDQKIGDFVKKQGGEI